MPTKPSMEYKVEGGRHGRFIIRSCFGGNNANFIASGSEVRLSQSLLPRGTIDTLLVCDFSYAGLQKQDAPDGQATPGLPQAAGESGWAPWYRSTPVRVPDQVGSELAL